MKMEMENVALSPVKTLFSKMKAANLLRFFLLCLFFVPDTSDCLFSQKYKEILKYE